MMKYGWHVVLADRLTSETLAMVDDGLLVRTLFYECDGEVPLEFCFITIRQGANSFLLFVTQHDYPHSAPMAYHAPFVAGLDMMDPVGNISNAVGGCHASRQSAGLAVDQRQLPHRLCHCN